MSSETTSKAFFEAKYRANPDPWDFASSDYEQQRYRATLAALSGRRYRRAFEPGCSVGVLTEGLAGFCDSVDAVDISPSAVEQAKRRCQGLQNVHLTSGSLPDALPSGEFDLVVLSEIGYYFEENVLRALAERLVSRMVPGGTLIGVHWLGTSADHILGGDRVHEILGENPGLQLELAERYEGFRLDRWSKP